VSANTQCRGSCLSEERIRNRMSSQNESQPLLQKKYLIVLAAAIIFMLIINPSAKKYMFGWIPDFGGDKSDFKKTVVKREQDDILKIRKDISEMASWLENAPQAEIQIKKRSLYKIVKLDPNPAQSDLLHYNIVINDENNVPDKIKLKSMLNLHCHPEKDVWGKIRSVERDEDKTFKVAVRVSGRGRLGLAVEDSTPEYYDLQVRSMWPVPVSGTYLAKEGWKMAVGSHILEKGDTIHPSASLCGYQVISISRRCVWFAAFYDDDGLSEKNLPSIRWPDLKRVIMASGDSRENKDGNNMRRRSNLQPASLELRTNLFLRPGDAILFNRTKSKMLLDRLWPNAAKFRYHAAEQDKSGVMLDLLCVIVRGN
jgi:hypothetical protein